MSRPIYERGPHKELANLQQQNIINENIIEQLQIRVQQDEDKIKRLESLIEFEKGIVSNWKKAYEDQSNEYYTVKSEFIKFRQAVESVMFKTDLKL